MKKITYALVLGMMEQHDWDSLHDVVLDAADLTVQPSKAMLEQVLARLDYHIVGKSLLWGFGDTEVRDDVYELVEESVKTHGSLEAWLEAAEPQI